MHLCIVTRHISEFCGDFNVKGQCYIRSISLPMMRGRVKAKVHYGVIVNVSQTKEVDPDL